MSLLDEIQIAQRNAGEAAVIANLDRLGLVSDEEKLALAKEAAHRALTAAERAWYEYAGLVDVGPERTRAFEIYENVRNARRI